MPDVLNSIQLSGKILDEPKLRRPDGRRLAVLSFTAETLDEVGRNRRKEPVRWRAKIFGPAAEQAAKDLGREIHVVVIGRVSGYEGAADTRPGKKKKTRRNDVDVVIDIHKYAVLPSPVIVTTVGLEDGGDFVDVI
jgi:hypothetical protein